MTEENVRICFLHHSGFAVEFQDCVLLLDVWKDPAGEVRRIAEETDKPLYFFVSHHHGDHFNAGIWDYHNRAEAYIMHKDCRAAGCFEEKTYLMEPGSSMQIGPLSVDMGGSTDEGGSFWIRHHDTTVFHAGDLNWWHWPGEPSADLAEARRLYQKELAAVAGRTADIAFFPVDARQETAREWGVMEFLRTVEVTKLLVPMHAFGAPWNPSYYFRCRFYDIPLWIPLKDGEQIIQEI